MIELVVAPAGYSPERAQLFDGWIGDRKIVERSPAPLLKACSVLALDGVDHSEVVTLRHRGKIDVALKSTVGFGNLMTVAESGTKFVERRRW